MVIVIHKSEISYAVKYLQTRDTFALQSAIKVVGIKPS